MSILPRATCRVCGEPTRYSVRYQGLLAYDRPECRAESRRRKGEAVRAAWVHHSGVSNEERILSEKLIPEGWKFQFRLVPFVSGTNSPRSYILDFAFIDKKLCVEIDGVSHRSKTRQDRDFRRDQVLESIGWKTLRIASDDVNKNLEKTVTSIITWERSLPIVIDPPEPVKHCEMCNEEMPRPPEISPTTWAIRKTCSEACHRALHSQMLTGRPNPRKGTKISVERQRRSYIPCRICGEPTKIQGTPAHPRWKTKACDKPECQAASKEIRRQNQSAALKGNEKLIAKTQAAWDRRRGIVKEPSLL